MNAKMPRHERKDGYHERHNAKDGLDQRQGGQINSKKKALPVRFWCIQKKNNLNPICYPGHFENQAFSCSRSPSFNPFSGSTHKINLFSKLKPLVLVNQLLVDQFGAA